MPAEAIARGIAYAIEQPDVVDVDSIVIRRRRKIEARAWRSRPASADRDNCVRTAWFPGQYVLICIDARGAG
jgi:hypothetical protein